MFSCIGQFEPLLFHRAPFAALLVIFAALHSVRARKLNVCQTRALSRTQFEVPSRFDLHHVRLRCGGLFLRRQVWMDGWMDGRMDTYNYTRVLD